MLVIGIAGGSGSGKTTVVRSIQKKLKGNVVVIPQDSYYKDSSHLPMEERQKINFDHPDAIDFDLLKDQVAQLKQGKTIEQPVYSYITCSRSKTETVRVEPAEVVIIEGILIFNCKELREQMDIKIFVDADDDDRLMRIIVRDIAERGRSDGHRALFEDGQAHAPPVHRTEQALRRHHHPAGRSQQGRHRRDIRNHRPGFQEQIGICQDSAEKTRQDCTSP